MDNLNLFPLLHLAGGTFPTGAFSHSWGLETYVSDGRVRDAASFRAFLESYAARVLGTLEGPVLCRAYDLVRDGGVLDNPALDELDQTIGAMRLTRESREASRRTGKALLRTAAAMTGRADLQAWYDKNALAGVNYPVAFGAAAALLGAPREECLSAFLFASLNGLVQSGIKLIPLGASEAQALLVDLYPLLDRVAEEALATPAEEAFSFCPAFDLASIAHETLETRLYIS